MSDVCKLTAYWSSLTDRHEYSRRAAHLHLGDRRAARGRAGWQWGSLLSTRKSPLVLGEGALSHLQGRVCGVLMPSESSHPHASPRGPKRVSKMVVRMHIQAQPQLLGHRSLRNKCKPGSELTESTQGPFTVAMRGS